MQIAAKRGREADEQENLNAQAKMWELDKENWQKEESRLKTRIEAINRENQDFLLQQMGGKTAKNAKMNGNEFAFNKDLLRQINQKLKTQSQLGKSATASQRDVAGAKPASVAHSEAELGSIRDAQIEPAESQA